MGKNTIFDEVIDRHGTDCLKIRFWNEEKKEEMTCFPLWGSRYGFFVCQMRFLMNFTKELIWIFGYTDPLDEYF